jgi:hypothetical protein
VDTIIGALGPGGVSDAAYRFARDICTALVAGNTAAQALASMNNVMLESYLSALEAASPRGFRIGGGREEADGAVSFLVRFIGREKGITAELFVRLQEQSAAPDQPETLSAPPAAQPQEGDAPAQEGAESGHTPAPAKAPAKRVWVFEELILETARSREEENAEKGQRFDSSPYQRFF